MKEIQREGRSEYEVVTNFRKEFKIDQNVKLEYEIVDKGSNGFLSLFGARPTIIKFFMPEKDSGVSDYLEGILKRMGVQYSNIRVMNKDGETRIQISGVQDKGYLIGREGRLLNSLQHLVHRMLIQNNVENPKVVIDVDNYRVKQRDGLQSRLQKAAQKVQKTGKSETLEPMNPADRRLVHQYIEKQKDLKTVTVGNGQNKRVVIMPQSEEVPPQDAPRPRRSRRGGRSRSKQRDQSS